MTDTTCERPVRDRSGTLIFISNTLGIITGLFVFQRFAFKIISRLDLHLDDWFTLLTTVIGVPATVINRYGLPPNGIGRDLWTLTDEQITDFGRYFYVMEVIYFAQVALLKMALLFFYLRIFSTTTRTVRALLWATTAFTAAYGVAFVLVAIFQCWPVSFFWHRWDAPPGAGGTCLSINAIAWSNAAISIVLDIWMLAIPISQLKKLRLSWRKKAGAGVMFCTGALYVSLVPPPLARSLSLARSLPPPPSPSSHQTLPLLRSISLVSPSSPLCALPPPRPDGSRRTDPPPASPSSASSASSCSSNSARRAPSTRRGTTLKSRAGPRSR